MKWFKEHLNWTAALSYIAGWISEVVVGLVIGLLRYQGIEVSDVVLYAVSLAGYFAVVLAVGGWVLQQKGRSLWWVLLAGWFSPIWLPSKRGV